jgi:hypothetical protein
VHRRLVGVSGSEAPGCFVWSVWLGQCCGIGGGEEGEMIDRRGHRGRWDDGVREQKVSGSSDCWYRGHFPMVECIGILRGVFTQVFFSFLLRMCCFWWFNCVRWVEISSSPAKHCGCPWRQVSAQGPMLVWRRIISSTSTVSHTFRINDLRMLRKALHNPSRSTHF